MLMEAGSWPLFLFLTLNPLHEFHEQGGGFALEFRRDLLCFRWVAHQLFDHRLEFEGRGCARLLLNSPKIHAKALTQLLQKAPNLLCAAAHGLK